jgi:copper/silver efflux system protein
VVAIIAADHVDTGTGSEIMQRIAVPMIGGMISSTLPTLIVIPAIFGLVKGFRLPRGGYGDGRPNISTKHSKNPQRIPELAE